MLSIVFFFFFFLEISNIKFKGFHPILNDLSVHIRALSFRVICNLEALFQSIRNIEKVKKKKENIGNIGKT